jgi:hypothetical protein
MMAMDTASHMDEAPLQLFLLLQTSSALFPWLLTTLFMLTDFQDEVNLVEKNSAVP